MRLDCTAIVTGASSGIGEAVATALVAAGARVACASRTESRLADAVSAMSGGPGRAIAVPTDVRSWDAVTALVEETTDRLGGVDVLVNNAAVSQRNLVSDPHYELAELPPAVFETIVETNLLGAFHCTRAALPGMVSEGTGRLIHVSSRAGEAAKAGRGAYVPAKFGLEGLHAVLALELAATGVDSLVVRPPVGGTSSAMLSDSDAEHPPDVLAETVVRLAAGEGEHGGRYVPTTDGEDYVAWPREGERPPDHPDFG